jgi:hypothetical protein
MHPKLTITIETDRPVLFPELAYFFCVEKDFKDVDNFATVFALMRD